MTGNGWYVRRVNVLPAFICKPEACANFYVCSCIFFMESLRICSLGCASIDESHLHSFLDVDALLLVQTSTPPATTNNTRGKYEKRKPIGEICLFLISESTYRLNSSCSLSLFFLFLCLSTFLTIFHVYFYLSMYLFLSLWFNKNIYLSIYLPYLPIINFFLFVYLFYCLPVCLSICYQSTLSISGAVSFKEM